LHHREIQTHFTIGLSNPQSAIRNLKFKIGYFPFPDACRAIVPSYRRTVGPTSKFKHLPLHWHLRHYYIKKFKYHRGLKHHLQY
jgi:hypothetical protein